MKNTIEYPLKITRWSFPDCPSINKELPLATEMCFVDLSYAEELAAEYKILTNEYITQTTLLNKQLEEQKQLTASLAEALEKINLMQPEVGREGCTYGDTDYDSLSVCFGYNLAADYCTHVAGTELAKYNESLKK